VIYWTTWVEGQAAQELENLFLVSLPQQVITEWIRQRRRAQQRHCCTQFSARQPGTLSPALLQPRLSFAGAPSIESLAGANSAGISNGARVEIHMLAALQSTNFNGT
jgi:hypothetical protein